MALSIDALVKIAVAGGGLILDSRNFTLNDLIRIAVATKISGAQLILRNISAFNLDSLVQIGVAGGGKVVFDMTE